MVSAVDTRLNPNCEYKTAEQNEKIEANSKNDSNLVKTILSELGFGKFQAINYMLLALFIFMADMNSMLYIFTAFDLEYR